MGHKTSMFFKKNIFNKGLYTLDIFARDIAIKMDV